MITTKNFQLQNSLRTFEIDGLLECARYTSFYGVKEGVIKHFRFKDLYYTFIKEEDNILYICNDLMDLRKTALKLSKKLGE